MITTTYLQISMSAAVGAAGIAGRTPAGVVLRPARCPIECAALYAEVGTPHYWNIYRIGWTGPHWLQYLQRPEVEVCFIETDDGVRLGYLELRRHPDESVEIVNFGLRPAWLGQGFGRAALNAAIARGFAMGAQRVWLHTCSLDHPAALPNYYARGFEFIRQERTDYLALDAFPEPAAGAAESIDIVRHAYH